jgi:hypothetical protein
MKYMADGSEVFYKENKKTLYGLTVAKGLPLQLLLQSNQRATASNGVGSF